MQSRATPSELKADVVCVHQGGGAAPSAPGGGGAEFVLLMPGSDALEDQKMRMLLLLLFTETFVPLSWGGTALPLVRQS